MADDAFASLEAQRTILSVEFDIVNSRIYGYKQKEAQETNIWNRTLLKLALKNAKELADKLEIVERNITESDRQQTLLYSTAIAAIHNQVKSNLDQIQFVIASCRVRV